MEEAASLDQEIVRLDAFVDRNEALFRPTQRPPPNLLDVKQIDLITRHLDDQATALESLRDGVKSLLATAPPQ
jgi:hypothetical protein